VYKRQGFADRRCTDLFADYCEIVVRRLGDRVKHWITINEPWEHAAFGYLLGEHAPGKTNPCLYFQVAHHQLLAHGKAVDRIRSLSPDSEVMITLSYTTVDPGSENPKDVAAAHLGDQFMNQFFLDGVLKGEYPQQLMDKIGILQPKILSEDMETISQPIDALGLNYYSREKASYAWYVPFVNFWISGKGSSESDFVKDDIQHTSMGWEVYPQGLYDMLVRIMMEYNNPPVYITENGAAFDDNVDNGSVKDAKRVKFLEEYFGKAAEAWQSGVDLRGYFVWSFIDNFEWAEGFKKRFGIVHVDFETQKRTIKDSGFWYRDLIRNQKSRD
jgi:beta-glucosidase